jgi:hypothetical protein
LQARNGGVPSRHDLCAEKTRRNLAKRNKRKKKKERQPHVSQPAGKGRPQVRPHNAPFFLVSFFLLANLLHYKYGVDEMVTS